jgi:GNAT superfamily N-acetyltransferase
MRIGTDDSTWIIKQVTRDTIADIEQLHFSVYASKPVPNHYLYKFATGYTGIDYLCLLAYTIDGEPVSSLCLVPCFISYEGRRILAAQLTDGMTALQFRKKGLAGLLVDHIVSLATEKGIQLLFGFPNEAAYPVWVSKGWKPVEIMDRFMIPVPRSMQWYISSFMKRTLSMMVPGIEQEGCNNSVFASGFAGIERSKEYFRYKSYTYTKVILNNGDKAWIKSGDNLAIGDMEVTDKGFDEMIEKILVIAEQTGAKKVFFQASKGSWLHELFLQRYRAEPAFPVIFRTIGQDIMPEKIRFTFADIDIF